MRTFCVNKSHKDFKKLQSILNIHEDQLEDIIFQYYNKYNTLEFPTFDWIETFYFTPNNVVKNTAQIQLFNQQYQKLKVFNTKKEAQEYEEQVRIYFPNKDSFVTKHRTDGKYEVTVGIPKFEASYKGKTLITLPFALNRLFWKTVSLDKNTLGDQIIDKLISVFEKTHNYPDIRIEKLSEVTVQNALGEEERFVPDALGGKDIILGMQYLKDLNLLPRTKAIQEIKNTIIHESLHYITSDVINKVEAHVGSEEEYAFYDEINRLYNIAKEHFGEKAKEVYGLNNLKEFVAESFGNRRFQKQLSEIKDPNSKKGILNSFISALSNFFEKHFGINIKESVLEGIVNTTSNYMDFIWEGKTNTESSPILFGKDTIIINNLSPESLIALNINTPKDLIDFLGSYTFELKKANGERTVSNLITQNRYMGSYWVKRRATRDIILDSDYSIEKIKEILAHFGLEGSINFEEPKKGVYKISINEPVFNEKLNIIKQEEEERQYHEAWLQRLKEQEEINENYKKEVLDHLWELDSELASLLEQGLITINEAISKYEDSTGLDFWRGNYDYISSKKEYVESLNTDDITSQLMHHLNTYEGIKVGNSTELSNYLQKNGYTSIQEAIETEKEMQAIKAKAQADGTFMKAPNGKPTKLNERQWLQVRTKNFIKWFGDWLHENPKTVKTTVKETVNKSENWVDDSKVIQENDKYFYTNKLGIKNEITKQQFDDFNEGKDIVLSEKSHFEIIYDHSTVLDENGEPLVMYHVTPTKGIRIFDRTKSHHGGFWFSSDPNYYVEEALNNSKVDVLPVFLNIRKPNEISHSTFLNAVDGDVSQETLDNTKFDGWVTRNYNSPEFEGDEYNVSNPIFAMATNPNQIKSATDNSGEFSTENNDIQMFIGKKARTKFEQSLKKARPDMSDAEIKATLDFLHSLEDSKENTAYIKTAIRWIANRSLTLPQDHTKAYQAFELARKKHIDLQKYNTLGELIASDEMKPKEKEKKAFNPDKAKTFSNKRTVTTEGGRVFTVYDVENTEEGQREVCKALAAHYKMSPWCLSTFTATGEPTESAKKYWKHYSSLPRKIAFEKGKPVAFSSDTDGDVAVGNVKGTLNGIEFIRVSKYEAYAWDDENITSEERTWLLKNELAYEYGNSLYLTTKGISQADFGPNDPYAKLDDPNREAWWDMEDTHSQESLSDSIISDPEAVGRGNQEALEQLAAQGAIEMERAYAEAQATWTEEDTLELFRNIPFFKTPQGEIYGFVGKDNKIYLDERIISPEHPIHEYTHLWDRVVAKRNPKLWKRGIELMKKTSLWEQYANDPNYGLKWKAIEGMTTERFEELVASEVHARLVGKEGEEVLTQLAKEKGSKNIIEKLKSWLLDVWRELKSTFSNWSQEDINKLTLEDFNNMTLRDFVNKVSLDTNSLQRSLNEEYYAEREDFNKQLGEENTRTDTEKALNNWFEWGKEHIKFDEDSHIYYIDGKPVDYSVTEYYESVYGKPKIKGDYSHSLAIGKTMDSFYRDYFKGEDVLSKDYPNLNQQRKKEALVDVRRLESYLDKEFHVDASGKKKYKIITTEFPLAARINTPIGEQTIAGTMDMLVIDDEGNLHIFDFKAKTNTIDEWNNRRNYTAQLNLYRALLESINPAFKGKVKSLSLIWLNTYYPGIRNANYTTFKNGSVIVSDGTNNNIPLSEYKHFMTPKLSEEEKKAIIKLDIKEDIQGIKPSNVIPLLQEQRQNKIQITESTGSYAQRTRENITWSDVTLSFANDDTTAGERLTERVANEQGKYISEYLPTPLDMNGIKRMVRNQVIGMKNDQSYGHRGKSLPTNNIKLNIAGNGIYTLLPKGITQEQLNDYVTEYIKELIANGVTISEIRSGGQTGVDEAGIVAAQRLGIPSSVHAPKGFIFRNAEGKDISDKEAFVSRFNQTSQQSLPGPETKINIYAGTGENADLSNFAKRPFDLNGNNIESVEQGFQIGKFEILRQVIASSYTTRDEAYTDIMNQITDLQNTLTRTKRDNFASDVTYGARLRSIGNTRLKAKDSDIQYIIDNFFAKNKIEGIPNWENDKTASNIMRRLLKASFEQNPQALQRLLDTGNATLTHTQDKGKWGTEFPRLLMEVREELREQYQNSIQQVQETPTKLEKNLTGEEQTASEQKQPVKEKQEAQSAVQNTPITLSKEAQEHLNRTKVLKKKIEALQRDKWGKTLLKKSELQRLSVSIANNVSQMISEIEKNPNLISDYFGLDRAQLSETPTREEIINRIGINNFYMAVCAKYFQNSTDFSKVKKASAIKANFEVLMLLSNPILSRNEGIKIGFDYTKEEAEQIVNSFEDNEEANENNETTQEAWQNNVRTIAVEYTMLPRIRRLLSNLPLLKNGEQIKDEWGIPQTVGLREVIGTILNNVGGIAKNHEHMASLLASYMQESKNTWLQPVIDILNDKTGKYETEQSLLFVDFCKNPLGYSISGEGFVSHELSTKQDYARNQVKRAFDSKLWTIQNKTENTVNKEGLKDLKTLSLDKLKTKTGIKELYKTFGLYLSNLEAERIVALNQEELLNRNASLIVSTLEKAKGEFTPFDRNSDTGIASYLYNILQPYIKITQEGFTSTVFEDGKRYQQFVLPSFLSRFNSKVQNSSPEEFVSWLMSTYGISEWYKLSNTNIEEDQLGSVSDGWRNPILQLLATDESFRKQFAWTQNLGFRSNKLYTFMKTLSPNDCLRMQMDMFYASDNKEGDIIPAWYAVPLMANKPAAEFIKLNRYRGENYKAEILNLLAPMFIKEVYRIKLVRERKALLEKHPELEIQNFDERGDQFCNFEMFNDLSLEDTAIIEDFIAGKAEASELTALFNKVMTEKLDERAERESLIYYFNGIEGREFINFYWNNFWAKTAMEDLFLGDGAFYKNVVDKQKRAMQLHSSGKRANISATWNKESVTDGTHRTIILSSFKDIKSNVISNLKEVFAKKAEQYTGEERVAYEEYVKSIIKQYEEIDVTDGQSFTTLSAYRKKAIMFGQWGDVQEEVYNRLKNGEINLQDLKTNFQPIKSFQYSQINKDLTGKGQIASNVGTTLVPTQYKHAEYLLMIADALLKGKEENNYLKAIADVIEATHADNARDGIDTVLFESSVKEGGNAVINISSLIKANTPADEIKKHLNDLLKNYKDKESNNPYVHISSFEDYMIQQELPAHFKDHYQAFPSQARYLSITDLLSSFNGNEVLFKVGDKEYTVEELQKEWENTWSEEVDYGISKLIKDLGITDKNGNFNSKEERNIMLSKVLVEALLGSNKMNLETLQALMPDENGNFTMPIDDPVLATTIMPLLFSEIKSRVNKQTAAGGPVVQVTSFGTSKKLNIRFKDKSGKLLLTRESWEKQKDKKDSTYEDYLRKNQAGIAYMEVYATVPSEEIFEKFRDKQGKIDIEAINRMNPGILEMIGVRIPTEGKLSMWPLKIVGFLPSECGEVIMLPEEITKITGSDFDSDKQYIIRRALSVVERTAENKKEKVINYILEQNKNYTREFVEKAYDEYMENPENYKDSEDVHWEVENALSKAHIKYATRAIGDHNKRRNHIFDMMMAVLQHESVADQLLTPQGFEQLKKLAAEINGVDDFSELQNDPTNMNDLATYMRYYELNKEGSTMLGIFASQKLAHAVLSMDNYFLNLTGQDRAPFKLGNKTYAQLIALDPMYNAEGVLIGEILGSCVGASADVAKDPVLAYLGINSDNINIFITGLRLGIPLKSIVKLLNTSVIKEVIRRHHSEEKSVYTLAQKELKKLMEENGIKKRTEEVFTSRDALDDSMCALNAFLTLYDCYETVNALSKKTRLNSTTDSSVVGPSYGATLYKDGLMTAPITGIYDKEGNLIDSDNFYQHHPMLDSLYQAFNIVKLIFKDTSLGDSLNKVLKMGIRETGLDIRVSEPMTTKFVKFYQSQLLFYQNIKDRNKGIDIRKVANGYYDTFAKDFQKIKESNKENKFIQAIEINEDGLYIPKLDDFNREEIEALRLSWEDLAIDEPDLAREIFEYNIVKGGLSYNPTTFGHLAGNTVRNLVPGYKEAFTDTPNNILNKIYDDFIVKYWMELRIPMWTAQIEAEKTYKYIRFGDGNLYKINGETGKYEAVNTRIPIYQKLSEYVEEALSESEQGTQYQDSLEKEEMTSDTETEQAQLALDALRPETRNTTYQKYMKELSRHIKLSEKEINKINEELDQYC